MRKWSKKNPWYKSYSLAKARCTNGKYGKKGIKFNMTVDDFKELWFRDKAYFLKKPSIDRIDESGHYIKKNCRFIEFYENIKRAWDKQKKPCKQLTLEGVVVQCYESQREAGRRTGINPYAICMCVNNVRKTTGGYKWVAA